MPITMEICQEGRVVYYTGRDPWTLAELSQLFPRDRAHRDSAPYKVHVVVDMRELHTMPSEIFAVRKEKMANHPNTGHTVIIGANRFARKVVEIILRVANNDRITFFEDPEQAWTYVAQVIANETAAS